MNIKKIIFAAMVFVALITTASCQKDPVSSESTDNKWDRIADFGGAAVRGSGSFTIGTSAYIVSGYTSGLSGAVWQYNSVSNTWTSKSNFPGTARLHSNGFSVGTKGYIMFGMDNNNFLADFWEYDSVTDGWTKKSDFPGGTRAFSASLVINQKVYIIGGYASLQETQKRKDVWEFDPQNNTWTKKNDFPGTSNPASGFAIGSKGYFGTGSKDFWEYDPQTDQWVRKADYAGAARDEAFAYSTSTKGYMGIGTQFANGAITLLKDFYEYNPQTNTWTKVSDFGGSGRTIAMGFSIGNFGFFGGGSNDNMTMPTNYRDYWKYTPAQ